jgi:nucleoside-diphosphate-sugar epimerase
MKVLFIGGTGVISSACSRLAVERGIDLYLLTRGVTHLRPAPPEAHLLIGDIRDPQSATQALAGLEFDAVVNWVAFTPDYIEADLNLFRGRTGQYVFISSASAYQTPPAHLPVTESTILDNPYWQYSRDKAACEDRMLRAYREEKFPMTIVRPSHTYDQTMLPFESGWTVVARMRAGKPVVVTGDGTSLWTLTHNTDFARGFVPLLAHPGAIGEVFQITSDEWLTWNQIHQRIAHAAGVEPHLVHVPAEVISRFDPEWGAGLLGDKSNSMVFDNSKIKRLVPDFHCTVPFMRGAEEIMTWYDANPARQKVDTSADKLMDRLTQLMAEIKAD